MEPTAPASPTAARSRPSRSDATPPDARWAAVQSRDGAFDGAFFYAVITTGIYCRPSCPSRQAKRHNVTFFDTAAQARAAGFRSCLRCAPDGPPAAARHRDAVVWACRALEASESGLSLQALAERAGLSPHHFHRLFKQVTSLTPKAYFNAVRTRRLQSLLTGAPSVTQAVFDAGFNSTSRFYETAPPLGMPASTYRQAGAGQRLRYAVQPCALGLVLVAATDHGVCAIEFGDEAAVLVTRLRQRFGQAAVEAADPTFQGWVRALLAYVERPVGRLELPLDVQGTVFQQRVWQALRDIPAGQTQSYAELAAAIGQPTAVRAVAQACAKNPVAVAVPCHRVIRGDGQLSGYRWGVARKAELLRRESED